MDKDFKITVTRGSGNGGQHRNKVETCVIITHMPTGLKEKCEETRSKTKNSKIAYERLVKKINMIEKNKKHDEFIKNKNIIIANAGRIRTYNEKRNEVIDHRTGKKAPMDLVLNGEIDLIK